MQRQRQLQLMGPVLQELVSSSTASQQQALCEARAHARDPRLVKLEKPRASQ